MPGAEGIEAYRVDVGGVLAAGASFSDQDFTALLRDRVISIVHDDTGRIEVGALLADLAETSFAGERLQHILEDRQEPEPWRICEAIAEVFLTDERSCTFPWPTGRDLKNPASSPAGADLVGFVDDARGSRFAYGEVKASQSQDSPPSVMYGRSGLVSQLESLRDDDRVKGRLMRYLAFRAKNAAWFDRFQAAARRYLNDPTDVSLFGVLVRDIAPNQRDLETRAQALASGRPEGTGIELRAKYLPVGMIGRIAERVTELQSDAGNN